MHRRFRYSPNVENKSEQNIIIFSVAICLFQFQYVETAESIAPPSEAATEAAAATATSPVAEANTSKSERANWGNDIEFLMSCIAMSVGLGNVWRFPFTALENGGGAFLIPYLIVLSIIGRPLYYMEMIIGQFSSRGSIKVYDMVPALRGKIQFEIFPSEWQREINEN